MVEHTKIRVKPLEWVEDTETTTDDDGGPFEGVPRVLKVWRAGPYTIIRQPGLHGRFILRGKSDGVGLVMQTLAPLQAAAQADYERRILSAIEPDPDACNAFDDLVAALKRVDASWTEAFPDGPDGSREYLGGLGKLSDDTANLWRAMLAALSRAGAA